jgi:predicted nucleic acid-binding protein
MGEQIVINTGPLVALAKAEALEIVGALPLEFLCPPAVRSELDAGAAAGHVDVRPPWLTLRQLRGSAHPVATAVLDQGEAEVIQLALDEGVRRVCIDERAGASPSLSDSRSLAHSAYCCARRPADNRSCCGRCSIG